MPRKALKNQHKDIVFSPSRVELRKQTNYNPKAGRATGYAPLFHAMVAEIPRISRGAAATHLLLVIIDKSLGRKQSETGEWLEKTLPLGSTELAELANCDERTIARELDWMAKQGIISTSKEKAKFIIQPLFRDWANVPTYSVPAAPDPEPDDPDDPEPEELPHEPEVTVLTSRPQRVAPGRVSKAVAVKCGVTHLSWVNPASQAIDYHAVVKGGHLLVVPRQAWQGTFESTLSFVSNELTSKTGHGCPKVTGEETAKVGHPCPTSRSTKGEEIAKNSSERKAKTPIHPRAVELSSLFDPLIMRYCGKTLSGDPQALQESCQAIGDTPHDYLVKAAVERGSRPINRPKSVVAICQEIHHNWKAGKDLPQERKLPTREEIAAMAKQEAEELAAWRKSQRKARLA